MPYQILESDQNPVWVPDGAVVRGPISFTFDTPGLEDGIEFYTPTVGDIIVNAAILVDTAFDGTTPRADIGTGVGSTSGVWKTYGSYAIALEDADDESAGTGLQGHAAFSNGDLSAVSAYANVTRASFLLVTAANPLLVWASQNGLKGGTAIGGTTGAARLYIVTATPVAF